MYVLPVPVAPETSTRVMLFDPATRSELSNDGLVELTSGVALDAFHAGWLSRSFAS